MASASRSDLPLKEWKLLAFASGNRCAFPGCDRPLSIPAESGDDGVVTGVAAHIVGASRQGPRGDLELTDDERDKSSRNRILLCPEHHKLIDDRPRVYTVQALVTMKMTHERLYAPSKVVTNGNSLIDETLHASCLPISGLPSFVMSLPLRASGSSEGQVAQKVRWPKNPDVLIPFIVRDKRLYTFADLSHADNPFADVVEKSRPEVLDAKALWSDPEGHRRYVALLNKCMTKHLGRQGLRFDRDHHRHWFLASPGPAGRTVKYRSKGGRHQSRDVVRQRVRKATGEAKEWWHVAAGLRFERVGEPAWVLTIRPEYEITSDGITPLPPKVHSARSARRKSKLYNEGYLDLLRFWLEFLLKGQPRLTLLAADQRIVIEGNLATCRISWPGVKDDHRTYLSREIPDNLFTAFEQTEAEEQLSLDEAWWREDEHENDGGDL